MAADRKTKQSFRGKSGRRGMRWHAAERRLAAEGHAIGDSELRQQGRNVKLHRAFRHVELRCDFLVRETLNNAIQHFLFASAYLYTRAKSASRSQKFLSTFRCRVQERLSGNN